MTISRVKPDFALGDKLTSAEMDAIDTNATYALDKRAGQTDTLASIVTCSGAGRLVPAMVVGADANTTYLLSGGNGVIRVTNATTASRSYTLSATGATTGDTITVYCESTFSASFEILVKDQSSATMFTLGNADSADGQWATFVYAGGWRLFQSTSGRTRCQTFTASGTFTGPPNVTVGEVMSVGGGGGGGSGAGADTSGNESCTGGGGGGGSLLGRAKVTLTPAGSHTVTIGSGGAGGAAVASNTVGNSGSDGGDTSFNGTVVGYGAAGGSGGYLNATSSTFCPGGPARRGMTWPANSTTMHPGHGGGGRGGELQDAGAGETAYAGAGSAVAVGGAAGLGGTATSPDGCTSGGGGGGGGASGWVAGTGGAGGNGANSNGTAVAGSAGTLGGGGGGGGGGSQGDTATGGAAGAAGGNGALIIFWVK